MKNIYRFCLLALTALVVTGVISCKKYNQWDQDESHERLFRPTGVQAVVDGIKVTLKWKNMPQVNSYVVELSQDSLKFTQILKTYTGIASKDADGYFFVFPERLNAQTRYSARIKGTDTIGIPESNWSPVTFLTATEQLLSPIAAADLTSSQVTVKWKIPNDVTHFMLNTVRYDINAGEKSTGVKTITGLTPKTNYTITLYNNADIRGLLTFRTPADIPTGPNVTVLTATDSLSKLIPLAVPGAVFVLLEGTKYTSENNINIPEGASFTIWGEEGATKPIVSFNGLTLPVTGGAIRFENIDLTGYPDGDATKSKRNYIFNQSTASTTAKITFENCTIRNLVNTPVRMQGANAITIDSLIFNRCISYDIGDNGANGTYAFINTNVATGKVNNIKMTNSTFYNIGYGLILHSPATSQSVVIENCTFNNTVGNGRYFIDYNGQTIPVFSIKNIIMGKTLSPLGTGRGIRATTVPVVINSYKTLDVVFAGNAIPSITDYIKPSTDLFTNPTAGNFLIKDNTFAGKADSGDPRWRP